MRDLFIPCVSTIPGKRTVVRRSMWPVPRLPDSKKRPVVFEVPVGDANGGYIAILDTHLPRGLFTFERGIGEEACKSVLFELANKRRTVWKYEYDPLFWLLGVRWQVGSAARALTFMERGAEFYSGYRLSGWPSPASIQHRTLAAWACRSWERLHGVDKLCSRVSDGLRNARRGAVDVQDNTACRWLFWYMLASGINLEKYSECDWSSVECKVSREIFLPGQNISGHLYATFLPEWRYSYATQRYREENTKSADRPPFGPGYT